MPGYHEGYALTLHSPVPAEIGQTDFGDDYVPPFPRRATLKLAQALRYADIAVEEAIAENTLKPFDRAVTYGVSANFCDSVAELAKKGHGIAIDLAWAGVRPSSMDASRFRISAHSAEILMDAAQSFRLNEPMLNESVIAQVVKLEREPQEFDGRATVLSIRKDHPARMHVKFEEPFYSLVIKAFDMRSPISMDGDIHRTGNGYELRNPRNIALATESLV